MRHHEGTQFSVTHYHDNVPVYKIYIISYALNLVAEIKKIKINLGIATNPCFTH